MKTRQRGLNLRIHTGEFTTICITWRKDRQKSKSVLRCISQISVFELIPNICTYCYKPSHQVSFHSFNLFIFNSRFYQFSFIASGNVSVRYLLVNQNIILLSLEHDWFENNKDAFALDNSLNSLVEDHLSYSLEKKK